MSRYTGRFRGGGARFGNKQQKSGVEKRETSETREIKKGKKDDLYYCNFCNFDAITNQAFLHHCNTNKHKEMLLKEQTKSRVKIAKIQLEAHNLASEARKAEKPVEFCLDCLLQYSETEEEHKNSSHHKDMLEEIHAYCDLCEYYFATRHSFEQHKLSQQHIRNRAYRMIQDGSINEQRLLQCPAEYDAEKEVGFDYVVDKRVYHCKPCDKYFHCKKNNEDTFKEHCKSEAHFNKYKEFCEEMKIKKAAKAKEEQEKAEKKKKEEEEAAKKKEQKEEEEENVEKEEEVKEETKEEEKMEVEETVVEETKEEKEKVNEEKVAEKPKVQTPKAPAKKAQTFKKPVTKTTPKAAATKGPKAKAAAVKASPKATKTAAKTKVTKAKPLPNKPKVEETKQEKATDKQEAEETTAKAEEVVEEPPAKKAKRASKRLTK